ncbi:MAG: exonuclease SbcCD subunit D C-terminal domain-containing protein [Ignavibacteria bacterium]|nr:exonuclease SbcCD subunit D C-terminal domain-containing protein [Ignavibacteria bacterium]
MRILHTSDWHLGQRFCERDRDDEHRAFLTWLLEILQDRKIDALIHSGDVFDMGNPPSYALELYYTFLRSASLVCPNIIITGGNHDSPATLNAPKELLKALNIHVVGATGNTHEDGIFTLYSHTRDEIGVVCAVPFLRDKDLRFSVAGELAEERELRIREGIRAHYRDIAALAEPYKQRGLPVIATGHLFAAGSEISDSEHSVMGNLGQVTSETFSELFDYIALGHIHRPQRIGGRDHIRYCGSPIPLSFSEISHPHTVIIAEFSNGTVTTESIEIPQSRRLLRMTGTPQEIIETIQNFESVHHLPAWVEAIATLDAPNPSWTAELRKAAAGKHLELIRFSVEKSAVKSLSEMTDEHDLQLLSEVEVFELLCEAKGMSEEATKDITATYHELLTIMREMP